MIMRSGKRPVSRLVAALLVFPLLALATGALLWHEGHGCHFEKDCVTCRWAADSVAEAAAPVAQPRPVEAVEASWVEPTERVAEASPEATSSRGPPLS